jgi:hypothetical protein
MNTVKNLGFLTILEIFSIDKQLLAFQERSISLELVMNQILL